MTDEALPNSLLDYGGLEGGLARMMDRFREKGTLTGDEDADAFIRSSAEAVLLGMLFDQRVRAEYAFTGPQRLKDRLGHLDMQRIADMDADALRAVFAEKPAVHRFTNRMAELTHRLAQTVVEQYNGNTETLWNDGAPFPVVEQRMLALPGFGPQKAHKMKFALHYFAHRDFSAESD